MKIDTMSKKIIGSPKTYHDGKFIEDEVVSSIKLDDEILCGLWYVRNDVGLIKFNPYNNVFTPVNFKYRVYNILKLNDTIVLLNTNSGMWRYHFRKNMFEKVNLYNISFFKFNEIDRIGSLFNFGSEELLFGTNKGLLIVDFKSTLVKKIASIFDFETSPNLLRSFPRSIFETDTSYIISWFEYINYTQYYKNWKPAVRNRILDSLGCIFEMTLIDSNVYCSQNHELRILNPLKFENSKSIFTKSNNTLSDFKVREIIHKSSSEVWIKCFDKGIFSFDLNRKIITSSHGGDSDNPEGLYGGSYYVMKKDKCGKLVVGTPEGISYYNESTCSFKKYYLPKKNTFVSDVDFDNFGNYWIAAGSHIVRFNPSTNEADYIRDSTINADSDFSKIIVYDDSTIVSRHELGLMIYFPYSGKFIDVTDRDGFEVLNEDFGIFYMARNKHIICGSYGTLYDVNIEELCQKRFKGFCKISLVRTASRDIFCKFDSPLSFGYNENDITIFFSSQGYNSNTFDQYYYSINNEIQFKPLRSGKLELYNLNPGKYNIHLRIKNDQFIQEYNDATLELNILPPWYASLWFRILFVLILLYIFYWLFQNWKNRMLLNYKMEIEKKQALDEERQRIARDMHDDLGSSLSALSLISANLQNSLSYPSSSNKKDLSRINMISEKLNQNIREIIWTTNSSNDNLDALVNYLERFCFETRDIANRDIRIIRPKLGLDVEINSIVRKMIYLICKEAINNAIKYTKGIVVLKVEMIDLNKYAFKVEDQGPGFDLAKAIVKVGSGLHNFQHRILLIPNANLNIQTSSRSGTIVELLVNFD
jgi:signal transduction histidine kinase